MFHLRISTSGPNVGSSQLTNFEVHFHQCVQGRKVIYTQSEIYIYVHIYIHIYIFMHIKMWKLDAASKDEAPLPPFRCCLSWRSCTMWRTETHITSTWPSSFCSSSPRTTPSIAPFTRWWVKRRSLLLFLARPCVLVLPPVTTSLCPRPRRC